MTGKKPFASSQNSEIGRSGQTFSERDEGLPYRKNALPNKYLFNKTNKQLRFQYVQLIFPGIKLLKY